MPILTHRMKTLCVALVLGVGCMAAPTAQAAEFGDILTTLSAQGHSVMHPAYNPSNGHRDQTVLRYGVTTQADIDACKAYWEGKEYEEQYFGFDIPCPQSPITLGEWLGAFVRGLPATAVWVLFGHHLPLSSEAVPR